MGRVDEVRSRDRQARIVKYPITSIFRSLQGEGHFVGYPTTFVRFAGCSVMECGIRSVCDEAPWKATQTLTAAEIVHCVRKECPAGIVCLTGGEPSDHDLIPVIDALTEAKFRVHIETSGIRELPGIPIEWITVSPKTAVFHQRIGHALKIVVTPGMDWGQIQARDENTAFFHRYLQPMMMPDGHTNIADVIAMLQSWDNYQGRWALSTQAHKTWGVM